MSRITRSALFALLVIPCVLRAQPTPEDSTHADSSSHGAVRPVIEPFPILSYDTDTGFGYGGKVVVLNYLHGLESFDLTVFGSTKGERWYRCAFSMPDQEVRQGTAYPIAVDAVVDYEKWINARFFGVGNTSPFNSRELFTKEDLNATITVGRGFTNTIVGEAAVRWNGLRASHLDPAGALTSLLSSDDRRRVETVSASLSLRFDTRDDFINPTQGWVLAGTVERTLGGDISFRRYSGALQRYMRVLGGTVALRLMTRWIDGDNVPPYLLSSIGGGNVLRGSETDRYIDKGMAVANAEWRMPLWRRLWVVAGVDAGKVWSRPGLVDLARWAVNPMAGVRLQMQTFVVRFDVGFGKESTGFFVNFGQLF